MPRLDETTWTDVSTHGRVFVALPVGSLEQHGPHLPLGTDTTIAVALADRLAGHRGNVLVAPPVAIAASGEHAGFPGTLSIGSEVLARVLIEIVRSADWAAGVILVNGHGGNGAALSAAVDTLTREGRNVLAWWPAAPDDLRSDAHAGWLETSVLLHLDPGSVRMDRAAAGDTRPLPTVMSELREHGVRRVSANGVLGDPTGATAQAGQLLVDGWADDLVRRFDSWAL